MNDQADEWVEDSTYDGYEVNRQGDRVYFILSSVDGTTRALDLSPEDAVTVGLALAQAGQEPMEESK